MTDKQRRLTAIMLGLLFGLVFLIQARLWDLINLHLQDVPYYANFPFWLLSLSIPPLIALVGNWTRNGWLNFFLATGFTALFLKGSSLLPLNIPPYTGSLALLFLFYGVMGFLEPSQWINYLWLGTLVAILLKLIWKLWFYNPFQFRAGQLIMRCLKVLVIVYLAVGFGATYTLDDIDKKAVLQANDLLRRILLDSNAEISHPFSDIPNFRGLVSSHYNIEGGPNFNSSTINIFFDNGQTVGCIWDFGGKQSCQLGPIEYTYGPL